MLCSKCGNNSPDDSKFCVYCGNKLEAVVNASSTTNNTCKGCGTVLEPGVKFCTKCGMKQESAPVQQAAPQAKPVQQAAPQAKPVQQAPVQQPAKKNSSVKIVVIILVIFLVLALIGGAGFYCIKVLDVQPLEAVSGLLDSIKGEKEEDDDEKEDDDKSSDDKKGDKEESQPEKEEKGDVALLDPVNEVAEDAKKEFEAQNYLDGAIPYCKDALNQYVDIGEANNLHDEAQEGIDNVYPVYVESVIKYCDQMKSQGASAAGFEQVSNILSDAMEITQKLSDKDYSVDNDDLQDYKEETIKTYKDMYIESINDITEYANWSRDEAWNYANQAYSVKENGQPLLFNSEDLEDPLRMRYVYCLSWITRKRCEAGLSDGSLSNADVVEHMKLILEETDYNPMLLQDIVTYGSAAGLDVENYQKAYNAIVDHIKTEQGLTIGIDIGVTSRSSVDLNHFWYFNDLDGEDKYKVDTYNGTTAATREWIRSNVPVILGE